MYLKAECPNYRWTHDNEAPSMHQLVEALKALRQPQPQPQVRHPKKAPKAVLIFYLALYSVNPVQHDILSRHCSGRH